MGLAVPNPIRLPYVVERLDRGCRALGQSLRSHPQYENVARDEHAALTAEAKTLGLARKELRTRIPLG